MADLQYAAPAAAMENRPSRVRWSELIQAGVRGGQPDQSAFFQVGKDALLDSFGFAKAGVEVRVTGTGVVGRLRCWPSGEHFESPPITDSLAPALEAAKALEGAVLFPQPSVPVTCYDGTMLRDEINRQCTPAQLEVKRKSTGKWMKISCL